MGLRERKKEQTRRTIEDAAFTLFAERGYSATTVADIAEAANIAPRTFFGYFPSKEAVVFCEMEETIPTIEQYMRNRPAGDDTFAALRAFVSDQFMQDGQPHDHVIRERALVRKQLIADNEALSAQERHIMGRFEALIAECVAVDLGDEPDALQPRLVAAATIAALMSLKPPDPEAHEHHEPAEGLALLDETIAFLRGGIAALQERRATA